MDIPPEEARALVGPRADYYLTRWQGIGQDQVPGLGFNWAAFLLSILWMRYRRMYRYFWIVLAIVIALGVVQEMLFPTLTASVDRVIRLVVAITIGSLGNYWYYLHARRIWRTAVAADRSSPEALAQAGGVRWWPVILFLALAAAGLLMDPTPALR